MEEHWKQDEPCNQRRHDIAVGIAKDYMKQDVCRGQRGGRPAVVDIGGPQEVAGLPFEFEVAFAASFVHAKQTGKQSAFAAQRALQSKCPFVSSFQWDACHGGSDLATVLGVGQSTLRII